MIVVSNHLFDKDIIANDKKMVVRVNLAWMKNIEEAEATLKSLDGFKVYLDYPEGRTKPPKPVISKEDAIKLAKKHKCVKYFAISNIEDALVINNLRAILPNRIDIVPKIETQAGVMNLNKIISESHVHYLMLDKEDLYTNVDHNSDEYEALVAFARSVCKRFEVEMLELQGVIFSP